MYQNLDDVFDVDAQIYYFDESPINPNKNLTRIFGFLMVMAVSIPFLMSFTSADVSLNLAVKDQLTESKYVKFSEKSEEEKKTLFKVFQSTHSKKYDDVKESERRYEIFRQNLDRIDDMNSKQPHSQHHISKYADWTQEEFQQLNGFSSFYKNKLSRFVSQAEERKALHGYVEYDSKKLVSKSKSQKNLPSAWDWRNYGAVTPVKDQLNCGACWAFAAVGDIEGTWQLNTGQLLSLSEQEVISCAATADGCSGGMMSDAYRFVIENDGVETILDYPYSRGLTGQCQLDRSLNEVSISSWTLLQTSSVEELQAALKTLGPIAIAINADQMQFYSTGIDVCVTSAPVNHAVLLVGYGNENGEDYWIIKNSWGVDWGDNGYYYISTTNDACGVGLVSMKSL